MTKVSPIHIVFFVGILIFLTSCATESGEKGTAEEKDSASVELVETPLPSATAAKIDSIQKEALENKPEGQVVAEEEEKETKLSKCTEQHKKEIAKYKKNISKYEALLGDARSDDEKKGFQKVIDQNKEKIAYRVTTYGCPQINR